MPLHFLGKGIRRREEDEAGGAVQQDGPPLQSRNERSAGSNHKGVCGREAPAASLMVASSRLYYDLRCEDKGGSSIVKQRTLDTKTPRVSRVTNPQPNQVTLKVQPIDGKSLLRRQETMKVQPIDGDGTSLLRRRFTNDWFNLNLKSMPPPSSHELICPPQNVRASESHPNGFVVLDLDQYEGTPST
jgi:hypothetical protein